MRKLNLLLHTSLDGFAAGPNGEMNWIKIEEKIFDLVGGITNTADTALYGRNTYQMMEAYWPTAANQPEASKHDIEHSQWYNTVEKVVLSKTLKSETADRTSFIDNNAVAEIKKLKEQNGKDILLIGSPAVTRLLIENDLIDNYWLFVNPIILGEGIPAFTKPKNRIQLELMQNIAFSNGVTALHYTTVK